MGDFFIQLSGGVGKQVAFTALLPLLKEKYDNIYLASPYPDIFTGNPYITEINPDMTTDFFKKVIKSDETKIVLYDPYDMQDFIKRKLHLLEAWGELCDLSIENGMNLFPEIYIAGENERYNFEEIYTNIMELTKEKYILVQFHGGQSPYDFDAGKTYSIGNDPMQRAYPVEYYKKLVNLLKEKYPEYTLIRYGLPNEFIPYEIRTLVATIDPPILYKHYAFLAEKAFKIVCIDSSLHHIAIARKKKCVVIWGQTEPKHFGYNFHTNLREEQEDIMQPYFRLHKEQKLIVKFPTPEKVMEEVNK